MDMGGPKSKRKSGEDSEIVKTFLQKTESESGPNPHALPVSFFMKLVMHGLHLRLIEPGRIVFSMKVPPRLVNGNNCLHIGAVTTVVDMVGAGVMETVGAHGGVSLEINLSCFEAAYLHEEIEIEATALRVGKAVAAVTVELRKKSNGKVIAQGRHTMYPAVKFSSRL